jgi:hypothetical protein
MRRSATHADAEEPLSLNSLLDTLMNVVGVSLILLAAADLSLIRTMKEIASSKIPRDISQRLEVERTKVKHTDAQASTSAQESVGLADEVAERARLMSRLKALENEPTQFQELLEKLAQSQRSLKALQDEGADLDSKIGPLKAEIAKLSEDEARGARGTTIQLPIRRTVAKELDAVTVVCRNGRVLILNYNQLGKAFGDAMQTAQARFTASMTTAQRARSVVSYFDTADVGNPSFRLSVQPGADNNQQFRGFILSILPRKLVAQVRESPVSAEDLSTLRSLSPDSQYLRFLVWEDSFPLYLSIRGELEKFYSSGANTATRVGLSWVPYALDEEVTQFIDMVGGSSATTGGGAAKGTIIDN